MAKLDRRLASLEVLAGERLANKRCENCIDWPAFVVLLDDDEEPEWGCGCEPPLKYVDDTTTGGVRIIRYDWPQRRL